MPEVRYVLQPTLVVTESPLFRKDRPEKEPLDHSVSVLTNSEVHDLTYSVKLNKQVFDRLIDNIPDDELIGRVLDPNELFRSTSRSIKASDGYRIGTSARTRIKRRVSGYFLACDDPLKWITFTLPRFTDGRDYDPKTDDQKVLDEFKKMLKNLKNHHGLEDYIWVGERQSGSRLKDKSKKPTNALHFHCIFRFKGDYVSPLKLNGIWLKHCHNLGCDIIVNDWPKLLEKLRSAQYVDFYKKHVSPGCDWRGVRSKIEKQFHDYVHKRTFPYRVPLNHLKEGVKGSPFNALFFHPVDVVSIEPGSKGYGKITNYLSKYVSKSGLSEEDTMYCQPWFSSRAFSKPNWEMNISHLDMQRFSDEGMIKDVYSTEVELKYITVEFCRYVLDYDKFCPTDMFEVYRLHCRNELYSVLGDHTKIVPFNKTWTRRYFDNRVSETLKLNTVKDSHYDYATQVEWRDPENIEGSYVSHDWYVGQKEGDVLPWYTPLQVRSD